MKRLIPLLLLVLATPALAGDKKLPKPMITGLKNPESAVVGSDGRIYITEIGEFNKDGDGRVLVLDNGKAVPFAAGFDDPKGIVAFANFLFVADNKRVWKIDNKGQATVYVAEKAFPIPPLFLNDIAVDEKGIVYVSDSGDLKGNGGIIFRIEEIFEKGKGKDKGKEKGNVKSRIEVTLVTDGKTNKHLKTPNGLVMDGKSFLLMLDFGSGELLRVRVSDAQNHESRRGV